MMDRRVAFDFDIVFTNGGGLQGQDFRLDVPSGDVTDAWIGDALVSDLRLLMVGDVRIRNRRILRSHTSAGSKRRLRAMRRRRRGASSTSAIRSSRV